MIIFYSQNSIPLINGFYFYKELPENNLSILKIIDNEVSIIGDFETINILVLLRMEQKKGLEILSMIEHNFNLRRP